MTISSRLFLYYNYFFSFPLLALIFLFYFYFYFYFLQEKQSKLYPLMINTVNFKYVMYIKNCISKPFKSLIFIITYTNYILTTPIFWEQKKSSLHTKILQFAGKVESFHKAHSFDHEISSLESKTHAFMIWLVWHNYKCAWKVIYSDQSIFDNFSWGEVFFIIRNN